MTVMTPSATAIVIVFIVFCAVTLIMVGWTYYGNREWIESRQSDPMKK